MFHNSTTLHHNRNQFSASSKETRLVYELNWFAKKQIQLASVGSYLSPLKTVGHWYSYAFGWPFIVRGADLAMKGLGKAVDGVSWAAYTAKEAALGATQMTAAPVANLAFSRLRMIKDFLWNVPGASFSAAIRTPIAMAQSPWKMILGVRDAIKSVPKNAVEILKSVTHLKLWDTVKNTRNMVRDLLLPPISRPLMPMLAPAAQLGDEIFASMVGRTVAVGAHQVTDVIPGGYQRIMGAPDAASAKLAEVQAERAAAKAALEKEKEAKREALKAAVAESRGEAPKGGGKK